MTGFLCKIYYIRYNNLNMAQMLKKFRDLMILKNISIYILPRTDEHQSQYLCECDQRVSFISGFSGSNAIALISQQEALLWTDGRYFLQAEKQLYQGWQLRKLIPTEKKWFEHIIEKYPKGSRIGIDGRLLAASTGVQRSKMFKDNELEVQFYNENLIDQIWENRPPTSATDIYVHEEWAGKTMKQKVEWVRNKIAQKKGHAALFTDLSEIGWVLNLRSAEIPYNPFFKGILVVQSDKGTLYLPQNHPSMKNEQVLKHLQQQNIVIKEYPPVFPQNILYKKSSCNYLVFTLLKNPIDWDGIDLYRAVRQNKQIQGFKRCHVSDAIAQVKFWAWRSRQDEVDEWKAAQYINNLRLQQKHNKGLSFDTISGGGPNAAVIHYHPTDKVSSIVTKQMIHLVDSGGQYLDGTTDVTRTFHFGNPTAEEKDAFTRVLLGNLDVERMKWPSNTNIDGGDVDILARRHLYAKGMNYCHGTGHGVGYFQGVHEGPCGISKNNKTIFKPGMIVTNEPGYYQPGKYGIRIENMLLVVEKHEITGFENLTLCPYDKNLIDAKLLNQADRQYINDYHKRIWETVSPLIQDDHSTLEWLKQATSPL